jgi:hypothetical protein
VTVKTPDQLSEMKKDLNAIAKKGLGRVKEMAENYGIGDPDDYTQSGLIEELAERMVAQARKREEARGEEEEPEPEKPVKKAKGKPKAKAPQKEPEAKEPSKKKSPQKEPEKKDGEAPSFNTHYNGTEFTEERPGVCAFILKMLYEADKAHPVTKKEMLKRLLKQFPGRDEGKSKRLVDSAPAMFRIEKGLNCSSRPTEDGKGFWLEASETAEVGRARVKAIKEAKKKAQDDE